MLVSIEIDKLNLRNLTYSEAEKEINTMWMMKYFRQCGNINVGGH